MQNRTGVYFRCDDYASLWRRLLVDVIDSVLVGIFCLLLTLIFGGVVPFSLLFWGWIAVFFCYFVILKRSKFRTLGYRVCRVRIVGQNGEVPGLWSLTLRAMFLVFGPLNYVLDIMWLAGDPHRQALRDKFAQTYVVKIAAQPIGSGRIIHRYYDIMGYNFLFREIEAQEAARAGQS